MHPTIAALGHFPDHPREALPLRLLDEAEDDVPAFYAFPSEHWPKLRRTNPLERFDREIGRRTDVGIFPDDLRTR